ncbi:MAG: hypothetical protein AABX93_03505 [Nanoarchaeota archaeon]
MERAELTQRIQDAKKKGRLIESCENFAQLGEYELVSERDCSTHTKWKHSYKGVEANYENGRFHFGDGKEILVKYLGKEVLHIVDSSAYRDNHRAFFMIHPKLDMRIGELILLEYTQGKWEDILKKSLRSKSERLAS